MAKELTERQQQIVDLLEQGKKAPEIAKKLKISQNGVYQHIRRIRDSGVTVNSGSGTRGGNGRRKSGRKSTRSRQGRRTGSPTPAPQPPQFEATTPLQAVRVRRDAIRAAIKEGEATVTEARKALEQAEGNHGKLSARHAEELKQLDAAEKALSPNSKPKAAGKASGRRSGRQTGGQRRSRATAEQSPNGSKAGAGERHLEPVG
jgi:biotin operon repressor